MKITMFLQYWLQTLMALLCVPVMRLTGFRFSKAWRGNWVVNHVAANLWADGYQVGFCRFFNRYI